MLGLDLAVIVEQIQAGGGQDHLPGAGLLVITLSGDRISAMTRFDASVLPRFGLPDGTAGD